MFFFKIHKSGGKVLLAACDSDIAGKKFSEGKLVLEIKKDFYCGKKIGGEIIKLFPQADIINIAGKEIVSFATRSGWVSKNSVLKIKNIPHAQIFVL